MESGSKNSQQDSSGPKVNVLIVGDWVVDENWIVTTEDSPTSSHIGKQQFRSKITENKAEIFTLCAAGSVALMLHGLNPSAPQEDGATQKKVEIFGMGLWEKMDSRFLASLFCFDSVPYQTPHTLRGIEEVLNRMPVALTNPLCGENRNCLQHVCPECERLKTFAKVDTGTWRVIRVYKQTGSKAPELLHRYDWELPREKACPTDEIKKNVDNILDLWPAAFDVVIVVDHRKGCVTDTLIQTLIGHKKCQGSRWYARCKDPKSSWLDVAGVRNQLQLLVVGPKELDLDEDPWFYGANLSAGALKWLTKTAGGDVSYRDGNPYDIVKRPAHAVVVLHTDNRAAALLPDLYKDNDFPVFISLESPQSRDIRVGRHSVLFASLVAKAERLGPWGALAPTPLTIEDVGCALEKAHSWCVQTEKMLTSNTFWKPEDNLRKRYRNVLSGQTPEGDMFRLKEQKLNVELRFWHQALDPTNFGVVEIDPDPPSDKPKKQFQIWRSWSPVEGFISILPRRRREIYELVREVKAFLSNPMPARSLSSLIIGGPGWGKSFLVKCLADAMSLRFQEFNITHLASVHDLMSCFDIISSLQTQDPNRPLVVFWDEINALLDREHTYGYFLGPLWGGTYRRGGYTFQLKPCIWIFAGTDIPSETDRIAQSIQKEGVKGSDFMSRLNGPIIRLRGETEDEDRRLEQLEQLYTAVALIKRQFPDVLTISKSVLAFFYNVKLIYGFRSLEFVISRIQNVSHGKLTAENLKRIRSLTSWISGPDSSSWENETGEVDIVEEP